MPYYTYLFSPETFEAYTRSDRSLAGVRKNQEKIAHRLQVGDRLMCYVTKVGRWAGVLEVASVAYEDATPRFLPADDPFVVRFKVKPLVWLDIEKCLPIKEPLVWNALSFTKSSTPTSPVGWTGTVRRSLNRLLDVDGQTLEELLRRQAGGGASYPQDAEEWKRLLAKPIYRPDKDKAVAVTVPGDDKLEPAEPEEPAAAVIRESSSVQALLATVGETMGFKVWLPRNDRSSVLKEWEAQPGSLIEILPLSYDAATLQTVEQIDVLWLKGRSIVRAFEVEHTTAIYSGLLRMADLLALQPNMNIKLHIVAPEVRKVKVFTEIRRPVFSLLERGPLSECCTFISYDSLRELADLHYLKHTSDKILEEYEEEAE